MRSPARALSTALTDISRPTKSGMIINGYTTTSRIGSSGNTSGIFSSSEPCSVSFSVSINLNLLYMYQPLATFRTGHPQHPPAIFRTDRAGIDVSRNMYRMVKAAMTTFHAYKLTFVHFPRFAGVEDQSHTAHFQGNRVQSQPGQVKLDDDVLARLIDIHLRTGFIVFKRVPQLKGMEQAADLADMPVEYFLSKRFPA